MQTIENQIVNVRIIDCYFCDFGYVNINLYFSISPQYKNDIITIDLVQNSSQKTQNDVDIADVAYYFEKDVSKLFLVLF